jgi:arginase
VALYDELGRQVAPRIAESGLTIVVTGDCLAMLGTLAGAQRAGLDPSVVWFDAHGDLHTLASSTSGYLGGMALRMMMGGDADKLAEPLGVQPLLEHRIVLVDARDLDPAEVAYLATPQVERRTVEDINAAQLSEGPVIVHIDLDVINPVEVPGLRFPAAGGPSTSTVLAAVQRLAAIDRVRILNIACTWSEPNDENQQRVRRELLAGLITAATCSRA